MPTESPSALLCYGAIHCSFTLPSSPAHTLPPTFLPPPPPPPPPGANEASESQGSAVIQLPRRCDGGLVAQQVIKAHHRRWASVIREWESHLLANPLPPTLHNGHQTGGSVQGVGIVYFT